MSIVESVSTKVKAKIAENPHILSGNGFGGKSVVLELTGEEPVSWTFCFDQSEKLEMKEGTQSSDCAIEMKVDTFESLVKGSLNVPFALMTRKIKVHGETSLAAKIGLALQKLFK